MAMFFKEATPEVSGNPTSDYERVLNFRRSIAQRHLYDTVMSAEDWRYKLSLLLLEAVSVGPGAPNLPDGDVAAKQALRDAIGQLSEREQTILRLRYFEGMTFAQVAGILGVSEQSVSGIHHRAILRLRDVVPDEVLDQLPDVD